MKNTIVLIAVIVIALTVVTPAYADDGDVKRACTVNDNWFTKLFDPCVELASTPSVYSQPLYDATKWAKALNDAEQYLRTHNNGNNDPVDSDNVAWKLYCGIEGQPVFDAEGHPLCK